VRQALSAWYSLGASPQVASGPLVSALHAARIAPRRPAVVAASSSFCGASRSAERFTVSDGKIVHDLLVFDRTPFDAARRRTA
jgi:hypothetical protein